MNDDENLDVETRQKLQDISTRRKRDILQVYNEVMSCQCAHNIRLETAAFLSSKAANSNITPAEKLLCILVALLAALAAYIGYVIKVPEFECGCGGGEYF